MYSVVLMMALSGGSEAVDFGHKKCHGCTGAPVCTGAVYAPKVVYAPACTGSACHGARAACHGTRAACHGAVACTGSCHGGGLFAKMRDRRCHGCTGAVACYGSAGCSGTIVVPGSPGMNPETPKTPPKVIPKSVSVAPATIVVSLPAGATLTVDGTPTSSTAAQRVLLTPALDMGTTYVYTLQAQLNGQVQSQDIQVRAGETTQAEFSFPASVASR
jgi:uncharacterized protein (TIGR03000 family)